VIADLPPPIQGISLVSSWVIDFMKMKKQNLIIIDTTVKPGRIYVIRRFLKFITVFMEIYRAQKNELVYMPISHGLTLFPQIILIGYFKLKCCRIVVHHHSFLPISQPKLLRNRICHSFLRQGVEHIFLSEFMRIEYSRTWKQKGVSWVVTNHQVALQRTNNRKSLAKIPGRMFCYAGRMTTEKGFWDSSSLTRLLLTTYNEMESVFLGPALELPIIEELANLQREFPNRFCHIDSYEETVLTEKLQASTFFIFPSRYLNEASPLVVMEAQSLGNICFTSQIGSLATDVLPPGESVKIDFWLERAFEMISLNMATLSRVAETSLRIERESGILALKSVNQLEAVICSDLS
jgi:glycosyltransferase involved in cell wall biosynthesis